MFSEFAGSRAIAIYSTTKLPTHLEAVIVASKRDLMLKMYDQACQAWRKLVAVRFWLLAIVPGRIFTHFSKNLSNWL